MHWLGSDIDLKRSAIGVKDNVHSVGHSATDDILNEQPQDRI